MWIINALSNNTACRFYMCHDMVCWLNMQCGQLVASYCSDKFKYSCHIRDYRSADCEYFHTIQSDFGV